MSYEKRRAKSITDLKNLKVSKEDVGTKGAIPSPITGKPLEYEVQSIPANDIDLLREFEFNGRSWENLTEYAVSDIADSIKATGFNSIPVFISDDDKGKVVLAGTRRTFAVRKHGKYLSALVFKNLTLDEKKEFARVSDIYSTPSFLDKAIKINKYHAEIKRNGGSITMQELGTIFNAPIGSVSEMLATSRFHEDFFKVFPSCSLVRQKFVRTLIRKKAYLEIDDIAISDIQELIETADIDMSRDSNQISGEIEQIILNYLNPSTKSETEIDPDEAIFAEADYGKIAKVKSTKTGLVVSFKPKLLSKEDREEIHNFLSKYSK